MIPDNYQLVLLPPLEGVTNAEWYGYAKDGDNDPYKEDPSLDAVVARAESASECAKLLEEKLIKYLQRKGQA